MQQCNDTQLKLAWLPGMLQPPNHSLTLVVKGCFDLVDGAKAVFAQDPDAGAIMGDTFVNDNPDASLRYANDLVMYKPKADLTLTGVAYPQPGEAGCRVTFAVGTWRKSLAIFNERFWRWGSASTPEPFGATSQGVPLTYENAYGGNTFRANPVGKGFEKIITDKGEQLQPLPNIEHIEHYLSSPSQSVPPAGFGPLKDNWGDKTPVKGTYGDKWLKEYFPYFPPDFDWSYFNTAPQDQQVAFLRGDESLYFEHLRPELSQFKSALPALRPRLFVKGMVEEKSFFTEVTLRLDSLHVDMEEMRVNLVWRGVVGVSSDEYEEISHACLFIEDMEEAALTHEHYLAETEAKLSRPDGRFEVEEEVLVDSDNEEPEEDPEFAQQMAKMFADISKQMKEAGAPDALVKMIGPGMDTEAFMAAFVSHYDLDLEEGQQYFKEAQAKQNMEMRKAFLEAGEDPKVLEELETLEKQEALEEEQSAAGKSQWSDESIQARIESGEGFEDQELQGVDLSGWELSNQNFRGADLTNANLNGATIEGSDFSGADLSEAQLNHVKGSGAIFDQAILVNITASEADFSAISAQNSQFGGANLIRCNLTRAKLQGSDFSNCVVPHACFTEALLSDSLFENADMSFCHLEKVTAVGANFSRVNLRECFISKSDFTKSLFTGARLTMANVVLSDLSEATLEASDAQGIHLHDCTLYKTRAGEKSNFSQAQISGGSGEGLVLEGAELSGTVFSHIPMQGADFSNTCMNNTTFHVCDMKNADFTKANVIDAKLSGLNLFEAIFTKAKLIRTDLSHSNLYGAEFFQASLQDTNLQGCNIKRTKIAMGMVEVL